MKYNIYTIYIYIYIYNIYIYKTIAPSFKHITLIDLLYQKLIPTFFYMCVTKANFELH